MRYSLFVALMLAFGSPASTAWQTPPSDLWITVEPSGRPGGQASVRVTKGEMYVDGPAAWVGVAGQETAADPVLFSIRAWKEGEKARVVVYAKLKDTRAPGGSTETPIATFSLTARETVHVQEAEKWGGTRLAVSATLR
jgi:hypothetical protein